MLNIGNKNLTLITKKVLQNRYLNPFVILSFTLLNYLLKYYFDKTLNSLPDT